MSPARILLVLSDWQWTLMAMHLASAMARGRGGEVVLLRMVPVRHPVMLGDEAGFMDYTAAERRAVRDFEKTAAAYGVPCGVAACAYASYAHALVDVAEQLEAEAVFAPRAASQIPLWAAVQHWWLGRSLGRHGVALYTLEHSAGSVEWSPASPLAAGSGSLHE